MKTSTSTFQKKGSALLVAIGTVAVLSIVAGLTFTSLQDRYRAIHQANAWQESLLAAEAGVDLAMREIRTYVGGGSPWQSPWTGTPGANQSSTAETEHLLREGEGGQRSWAVVTVDAPAQLFDNQLGEQWFRIRSRGFADVPGGAVAVANRQDNALRRLDLLKDRFTGEAVDAPQVQRVIEVIAKPNTRQADGTALASDKGIDLSGNRVRTDSYSSRPNAALFKSLTLDHYIRALGDARGAAAYNASRSLANNADENTILQNLNITVADAERIFYSMTNSELQNWVLANFLQNGNIGTNGAMINVGQADIYGSASVGVPFDAQEGEQGEIKIGSNGFVTGGVKDDFSMDLLPVQRPDGSLSSVDGAGEAITTTSITKSTTVTASEEGIRMQVSSIKLSGPNGFTIKGITDDNGNVIETYAEVIVTGDVDITGNGGIVLENGVNARFFVQGDIKIAGNGFQNSGSPLALQVYGLDRTNTSGQVNYGEIKIAGNGAFRGTFYGPHHDLHLGGGGNTDTIFGSFVANNIKMNGKMAVHYDERLLNTGGLITHYSIASWFEDVR